MKRGISCKTSRIGTAAEACRPPFEGNRRSSVLEGRGPPRPLRFCKSLRGKGGRECSFSDRIYALLILVPAGRVTTYGELARAAGSGGSRAVGQVLRRNPDAPRIPCHRVIRSDTSMGGFRGQDKGERVRVKRALLEGEGILFGADGRLLEPDRVMDARELSAGRASVDAYGGRWNTRPDAPGPGC